MCARWAEKPLSDTILPALSEKGTEPALLLLLGILGICTTPWRNSGTCWVLVAVIIMLIIFTMTSKGKRIVCMWIFWYSFRIRYFIITNCWCTELFFFLKRLMFGYEGLLSQGLLRTISTRWQLNCRKCPASRSFIIAVRTFRSNLYAVLVTHGYLPFNLFHFMTHAIPSIITVWKAVSFTRQERLPKSALHFNTRVQVDRCYKA